MELGGDLFANPHAPTLDGDDTDTVTFTPTEPGAFTLEVSATDAGGLESVTPAVVNVVVVSPDETGVWTETTVSA